MKPEMDLNNLCRYFLNCITQEANDPVSQSLTDKIDIEYTYIHGLDIDPLKDEKAIELLKKISPAHNKKVYLGYPVKIYSALDKTTSKKDRRIAPVIMYAVAYVGGKIEISSIPSINIGVLKDYTDNSPDALVNELIKLENELGLDEPEIKIEKEELILHLTAIRQWDYKEKIDPNDIQICAIDKTASDGIYNRAILIASDKPPFTVGLESELLTLAKMPLESYKRTALYSWIKNPKNTILNDDFRPLLEVLPLNSEQAQAVNIALRSDLTIITGPPGTGKSQVVTDLLINIIWNGKRALFSSKNNKAVDVVEQRINSLCKRPVLLRMGGNQSAFRLKEMIEHLLFSNPKDEMESKTEFYQKVYIQRIQEAAEIQVEKRKTVEARNSLDEIEQKYCLVRDKVGNLVKTGNFPMQGQIISTAKKYIDAYDAACKEKQSFFIRLLWRALEKKREIAKMQAAVAYNRYAEQYGLKTIAQYELQCGLSTFIADVSEFEEAIQIGRVYKEAYDKVKNVKQIELLDQQLAQNKDEMAQIAGNLWNSWILSKGATLTTSERLEMISFINAMEMDKNTAETINLQMKKQISDLTQKMMKYIQGWAVTSLSAKSQIPFEAGLFDYLIIDEASQCDIASVIPLLYRAKHVVIIGDPMQLRHISQLPPKQDFNLLQKYNIDLCWAYSVTSLYALAAGKVASEQIVQLKDHFRSCADIIEFSNETFYDGSLRTATKYSDLKVPSGEEPGIRWVNITGETIRPPSGSAFNQLEAETIVKKLKQLIDSGYQGTIGVTTPFKRQAEKIKSILEKKVNVKLYEDLTSKHEFTVDTVHGFQGDERDVIFFSPVVSIGTPDVSLGFLANTGNLFNFAITRARALLIVVGNYQYCAQVSVPYLKAFAEYVKKIYKKDSNIVTEKITDYGRKYPWVANPEQVSDWEKKFYTALYDAGVHTIPQYAVEKYKLDLAVILDNDKKLDIEVDGEMYHKQWNGELCYRDQLRNQRMFELGWDVKRFWVYQIRDDMDWCIQQVKEWISAKTNI